MLYVFAPVLRRVPPTCRYQYMIYDISCTANYLKFVYFDITQAGLVWLLTAVVENQTDPLNEADRTASYVEITGC